MAKFGGFPGMGGANMNQLLRQAKKMQKEINEIIIPWIDNNIRPPGLVYRPV